MADTSPSLAPRDLVAAARSNPRAQFASNFKQAGKDSKPAVQRVSKKRGTPVKFSSAETKRKLSDNNNTSAAVATGTATVPKSGFTKWLEEGNGDRLGYEYAHEYLKAGPPYKGDSDFQAKDTIRDLGGKWMENPLKIDKDARDGIMRGWRVAWDAKDLEALITAPRNSKGKRIWTAIDVPDSHHDKMLRLMREYEGHQLVTTEEAEKKRKADAAASSSRAEAQKEELKNLNLQQDTEDDIKRLKDEYDVDWSFDLAMKAQASACLGPQMTTAIGRVLRGLKFKIISPEQASVGNFEAVTTARRAKARVHQTDGHEAAMVDASNAMDEEINYRLLSAPKSASSGCFMFGNNNPNHIPIPTPAEREKMQEAAEEAVRALVSGKEVPNLPAVRCTYCTGCVTELFEQFLDCGCDGYAWSKCLVCHVLHCSFQPCACANREEWNRLQNMAVREQKKQFDAAEQLTIDSGMGESSNPHGYWDDDPMNEPSGGQDNTSEHGKNRHIMDNWLHDD